MGEMSFFRLRSDEIHNVQTEEQYTAFYCHAATVNQEGDGYKPPSQILGDIGWMFCKPIGPRIPKSTLGKIGEANAGCDS